MRLYATTTSERASKGQGGNKQVTINLKIDSKERKEIGNVVMTYDETNGYQVYYYPINANCTDQKLNSGRVLLYESKGNKQKTAKEHQHNWNKITDDCWNCTECEASKDSDGGIIK